MRRRGWMATGIVGAILIAGTGAAAATAISVDDLRQKWIDADAAHDAAVIAEAEAADQVEAAQIAHAKALRERRAARSARHDARIAYTDARDEVSTGAELKPASPEGSGWAMLTSSDQHSMRYTMINAVTRAREGWDQDECLKANLYPFLVERIAPRSFAWSNGRCIEQAPDS